MNEAYFRTVRSRGSLVLDRFARRSVCPIAVRPNFYRPKRICRSLSLKKGNEHGKTVTGHVESKGNYIFEGMFTML